MRADGSSGLDLDRIQEAIWNARFRRSQPTGFQTRGLVAALTGHVRTLLAYAAVRQADIEEDGAASAEAMEMIAMAQAALAASRSSGVDHGRLADAAAVLMKWLAPGDDSSALYEAAPAAHPFWSKGDRSEFEERT